MHREKIDTRIVKKDPLCSVAVMHIPIDDHHTFDLLVCVLGVAGGDRDMQGANLKDARFIGESMYLTG